MTPNIGKDLAALQRLGTKDLLARYAEVFREQPLTKNRVWLVKRLAWRLQSLAEGDLSERARQRAAELANDADLRTTLPKPLPAIAVAEQTATKALTLTDDNRLPPPGTIITRKYKGRMLQVQVLPHGFEFEGEVYRSLSAVAKAITGSHCNGFLFFNLHAKGGNP
jgi:hypothetical protein